MVQKKILDDVRLIETKKTLGIWNWIQMKNIVGYFSMVMILPISIFYIYHNVWMISHGINIMNNVLIH